MMGLKNVNESIRQVALMLIEYEASESRSCMKKECMVLRRATYLRI